jgi:hypothetical protein
MELCRAGDYIAVTANERSLMKGSSAWRLRFKADGKAKAEGIAVSTLTRYL